MSAERVQIEDGVSKTGKLMKTCTITLGLFVAPIHLPIRSANGFLLGGKAGDCSIHTAEWLEQDTQA